MLHFRVQQCWTSFFFWGCYNLIVTDASFILRIERGNRMEEIEIQEDSLFIINQPSLIENVIRKGASILLNNGNIESTYTDALLQNLKLYGNNFVISPYIILPHARPEEGVLKSGVSIILLRHSIYLRETKDPIRLVIILAAEDTNTHLEYLKYFSKLLSREDKLERILNSESIKDLYREMND